MQFKALTLAALAFLTPSALGATDATMTVSYDESYDSKSASLAPVAPSDNPHGLLTKGYSTFSSLPHFPNIGGTAAIAGWNPAQCGTCWQLTYNGRSINVLAIDHADWGFKASTSRWGDEAAGQDQRAVYEFVR
ncbi:immunomodulatory protein [Ganoderma leucocontextum]|nr:immunomodulatory protein [Ganoderma leucocontextum]